MIAILGLRPTEDFSDSTYCRAYPGLLIFDPGWVGVAEKSTKSNNPLNP